LPALEPQDLGVDHDVTVDPLTGSARISIPLRLSAGRDAFQPHLTLAYSSSASNSPFGLGWSLDGIPSISVDMRRRLPTYDESQVFRLSSIGELVPRLHPDGTPLDEDRGDFRVRPFIGRDHSAHLLVERWTEKATGAVHWRTRDARNTLTIYGARADGFGRIVDPAEPARILRWLAEVQVDSVGNAIWFEYESENLDGVDTSTSFERARLSSFARPQRYPTRIRYGNTSPVAADGLSPADQSWCFELVFDYGDHVSAETPGPAPDRTWPARPDAFSTFRPGFDLRTYRLCRRVLVFHRFPALGAAPHAVADYSFEYNENPAGTTLAAVRYSRSRKDAAGAVSRQSVPALRFKYSQPHVSPAFEAASPTASRNVPAGLLGATRWIDLYGEGVSGILAEVNRAWYYKRNEGDGQFGASQLVLSQPAYRIADAVIRDFDADGNVDLVVQHGRLGGYYTHDRSRDEWQAFRPFPALPHLEAAGANAQWVDLDGDGRSDLLFADPARPVWYPCRGQQGFGAAERVELPAAAGEQAPGMGHGALGLFFADMLGDGGSHLVRIRDGLLQVWPHLGHGRFGTPILAEGSALLGAAGQLDPRRLLFADLNGDGTADIIYLGQGEIRTWINAGGNALIEGPTIRNGPMMDRLSGATVVDYFADGTLCLVWSSALAEPSQPMSILRLTDGIKPNLIVSVDNGMGGLTQLEYSSSARHYLRDRRNGAAWTTRLPMHPTVVDRAIALDAITGARAVTQYAYHDGHYDGQEQEFRGFGRVDVDDTETHVSPSGEDVHTVPSRRRLWHHLGISASGAIFGGYVGDALFETVEAFTLESAAPVSLEVHEDALRVVAGRVLRQEVYALDAAGVPAEHPLEVTQFGYRVRVLSEGAGIWRAAFDAHECTTAHHIYEGDSTDPRVSQTLALDVDEYGHVRLALDVQHARRTSIAADDPMQTRAIVKAIATRYASIDTSGRHELGLRIETKELEIAGVAAHGAALVRQTIGPTITTALAAARQFQESFAGAGVEARVAWWEQVYYWDDGLGGVAPLGSIGSLALLHHEEEAVFTAAFAAATVPSGADVAFMQSAGHYTLRDGYWWRSDPVNHYGSSGQFRRLVRTVRPDGGATTLSYDTQSLMVTRSVDAAGNATTFELDYNHLLPWKITDANGARTEIRYDALGVAIASTHIAQVLDDAATARAHGFEPISSFIERSPAGILSVLSNPSLFLQDAATAAFYDLEAWQRDGLPITVIELTAETLAHDGTGAAAAAAVIGQEVRYFDGFSRVIQSKTRVEPGPAIVRGPTGAVVMGPNGRPALSAAATRWLVSGHEVTNRKQLPVRRYEPFFSTLATYEPEPELAIYGVSNEVRYDGLSRAVRSDLPNGTFNTARYTAWSLVESDENDTVDVSAYRAARIGLPATSAERQALDKALAHAGTPTTSFLGPDGQTVRTVVRGSPNPDRVTQIQRDFSGEVMKIIDPRSIVTLAYRRDMQGRVVSVVSADAGETRSLLDAFDNPIVTIDGRGFEVRRHYDALDRPLSTTVREGAGAPRLVERHVYGEDPTVANAVQRHALGRRVIQQDETGTIEVTRYEPGGAILEQRLQAREKYSVPVDWNTPATVTLQPTVHISRNDYDALGRPRRRRTPDGATIAYTYLAGGGLGALTVTTDDGLVNALAVMEGASYNARGQRTHLTLGCGVSVDHTLDPETFRTSGIRSTRPAPGGGAPTVLQDVSFTYDPVGNVVSRRDGAHEPPGGIGVMQGLGVSAASSYTYDAFYQLIAADGRVHNALMEHDDRPNGMAPGAFRGSRRARLNDGAQVSRYQRLYSYDAAGNLTQIRHTGVTPFTKDIAVAATSNRAVPALDANGIPVPAPQTCFDAAGNCTLMPHLRRIEWNYRGTMSRVVIIDRSAQGQPDDAEYYLYDGAGLRTRKVRERLVDGVLQVTDKLYLDACEIKQVSQAGVLRLERRTSLIDDETGRIATIHRWTLDALNRETDNTGVAKVHYSLVDHLASAQLQLAGGGEVISYEEYFPYGGTAFIAGDDEREISLKEYRYNGKERDEATGFYYFGHRYYSTSIARWLSADPLGPEGGLNLYAYCFNNPVTLADPDGLEPKSAQRGYHVHYDSFEQFKDRVPPEQGGMLDKLHRHVGVKAEGGGGAVVASMAELQQYVRQHPGTTLFIYDPLRETLKSRGETDETATEFAETIAMLGPQSTSTKSLDIGLNKTPAQSDLPHSDHPTEDKHAAGNSDKGNGQGEATGRDDGAQPAPPGAPHGTGGPGAASGGGTGSGAKGAGTGGGGTGDQVGVGDHGRGSGLGQRGSGQDARSSTGTSGHQGTGPKPGSGAGQGHDGAGGSGKKKEGAHGDNPGGVPGGVKGAPPGGVPHGEAGGQPGGKLGGTPDGLPPDPNAPGGPSNGSDPTGSRTGTLAGDHNGTGPGNGVPGGSRAGSQGGRAGGQGDAPKTGGAGGTGQNTDPESAMDRITRYAGYVSLEFSNGEANGVKTGGIPGAFGSHVAGMTGQFFYIQLVLADLVLTIMSLGQGAAAKGAVRAAFKGAMAGARRFATAFAGLFTRKFWKKVGERISAAWLRYSFEMGVGKGAIKFFPLHTGWRVGKTSLHAGGTKPLYMITMRFRESLRHLAKGEFATVFRRQVVTQRNAESFLAEKTTWVRRVPAIRPERALALENKPVWSCLTANWSAWNYANYHIPNIALAGGAGYGAYRLFRPSAPANAQAAPNGAP
jgi:RHS repeat-associated protein